MTEPDGTSPDPPESDATGSDSTASDAAESDEELARYLALGPDEATGSDRTTRSDRTTDPDEEDDQDSGLAGPVPGSTSSYEPDEAAEPVRLHKVLAQAGVASRRGAEEMIAAGRVEVDGVVVTEMGSRVDPERAIVHVDGTRVPLGNRNRVHSYVMVHKPRGVVSTMWDDQGRPDIPSLLPVKLARRTRFFHVGRLDQDTEGLLLLTDDGELTHRLTHPSFGVSKTYVAEVPAPVTRETVAAVRGGVVVEGRTVAVERFRVVTATRNRALVEIAVHEGRKHVVRNLLDAAGLPVKRLVRIKFGPIALGNLPPGEYRELDATEVGKLYDLVGL